MSVASVQYQTDPNVIAGMTPTWQNNDVPVSAANATSYANPNYVAPSSGGSNPAPNPNQQAIDAEMALRNEIESGWNSYLGAFDDMLGGLGEQQSSQEGVAQNQYQQGVNSLDLQKNQGMTTLGNEETEVDQNTKKTLRDLSENLRNSMMAGNVYLGARGAGDSSAANQYSYALTKQGTKGRTDVMNNTANIKNDISQRKEQLTNFYNTTKNNLKLELDNQINQISQWFSQSQQQLKLMKAEGGLRKSQDLQNLSKDLLNQALSAVNQVQTQSQQTGVRLDEYAKNMADQITSIGSEAGGIYNTNYQQPTVPTFQSTPQMSTSSNIFAPSSNLPSDDDYTGIFANPGGLSL